MGGPDHLGEDLQPGTKRRRTSGMYQRRRAVTACQPCRARKTKCDNVRPVCGFCTRNSAQCVYLDASKDYSAFDPASLAILDRVNYAVSLLEAQSAGIAGRQLPQDVQGLSPASIVTPQQPVVEISPSAGPFDPLLSQTHPEYDLFDSPDYPATIINCEAVLHWPIFQGTVPDIQSFVLDFDSGQSSGQDASRDSMLSGGVREEEFNVLSKRFLAYVHIKNPILDCAEFKAYVRDVAEHGVRWDGPSCLVLIACALACVSSRFQTDKEIDKSAPEVNRDMASACYLAAKKRLGLIEPSLLSVQCLFLCGVFEMYLLKPVKAWFYFNQACIQFRNQLWGRTRKASAYDHSTPRETRRLEQRLYWSCMKSECELRCEIPLPPSGITRFGYPDPFPSPPTELSSPSAEYSNLETSNTSQDIEPEEERSWFYYLAEISFRRMMDRAIAALARDGERGWITNIRENLEHHQAFEEEINIWWSHVPPQINNHDGNMPPNELAHCIQSRTISCHEWICRPFLYYVIHQPADDPYMSGAMPLAEKCLDLIIQGQLHIQAYHRHHGTWYVARNSMTRALLLVAAARSGKIKLPERSKEIVDMARETLQWWSTEAPDLKWASDVLDAVLTSSLGHLPW